MDFEELTADTIDQMKKVAFDYDLTLDIVNSIRKRSCNSTDFYNNLEEYIHTDEYKNS